MYRDLINYTSKTKSFHMPGHKGGKLSLISDYNSIDVTEVDGTDDLHHPSGIIKDALDMISRTYKSGKSYMLVNGSTGGILSAISGLTSAGDRIAISRNCHKSVYNSVLINQLNPVYIYPQLNIQYGFYEAVTSEEVQDIFNTNTDIKAVVITSPTYEGIVSDIEAIASIVHAHQGVLIVDEAHGAHFTYSEYLPKSALEVGADIVIQSTHKTLPCLTQTAIMHISEEAITSQRINPKSIEKYLSIYQTSSPSYPLMASIEAGVKHMNDYKYEFAEWLFELEEVLNNSESKYGRWLYELRDVKYLDVSRLTYLINDSHKSLTGFKLSELLREEHQIQVELSSEHYIIGITTIADSIGEIKEFIGAIEEVFESEAKKQRPDLAKEDNGINSLLDKEQGKNLELSQVSSHEAAQNNQLTDIKDIISDVKGFINKQADKTSMINIEKPKAILTIAEASVKATRLVNLNEGIGLISSEFLIPYPPGIPLVVPGEEISREIAEYIEYLLNNNMEVYGIIEGAIQVVE